MSRKGLNIYKRKDGRWEARYIKSRNALGKPKYGYLYASSYREVRCDLQHTLQLQGKPSGSEERTRNSTFELVSMEWLDAFSINFKESTYIRYRTLIECYLMPSFQTVKIEKITKEVFDDEADFLPGFLDDAKLVFESGGGNVPFQMLSEHFWDDLNSVFAKDVGEAWIAADPQNADPYALLGAHYAALDDESGIEKLLQNAETNGVDFNTIDAKIKTNSDGTCTLTVQINDFLKDESGQSASVSVKVDAKDNAKTVTQKVAEKAADSAASKVVEKSGLTGEAAGIANSMAQEALRKGLGSAGSGQGTESSGTVTAPTYDPSQDSGESDDFDWSQIQSEFDSLKDEFPS